MLKMCINKLEIRYYVTVASICIYVIVSHYIRKYKPNMCHKLLIALNI